MELTAFLVILLILAFAGGGSFLILSALTFGRKARTNISWPAVKGKVLSAEIVESSGINPEGVPFSTFKPVTRFMYSVNGVEYISIQIGPAARQENDPSIHQFTGQYPVGRVVTVHFDPQNPNEAILSPQVPVVRPVLYAGIGLIIISALIACLGLTAFLIYFFTH